jgi:ABC-2 type transport system ATP-binding protein
MLLVTDHLTKHYGACRALENLCLEIPAGEVFGLLGPNGSGKSTALRLMLGMIRPTSGSARVGGYDCWRQSVEVRRQVAYLPGELRLYDNLTGGQLLDFLAGLRGQIRGNDATALARRFDLDLSRPISTLSSGMKRKLALLSVMTPRVSLLILDEPTNTLDPTMRDEFLDQLLEARARGQTVLFSSHVLQEVERVCDRVGILAQGKLVHVEPMARLRAGREITVKFSGPRSAPLPAGVAVQSQDGAVWTLTVAEHLPDLLAWLAAQPVSDLRIEPLGLGAIYRRHHQNGAG